MEEQHFAPFYKNTDSNYDDDNSFSGDSSLEVTSNIDENESELIGLSTYLHLDSTNGDVSDGHSDQTSKWPETPPISSDSSDIEQLDNSQQESLSTSESTNSNIQEKCFKRKRRQWNIKEKLDAVALFNKNKSAKRKRLDGGVKKLVYVDLDHKLFIWYRSRRTDPKDKSLVPADVRREKVTFRRLEK
ncbi:unnamed protein product [Rotaria magnacalcarata]